MYRLFILFFLLNLGLLKSQVDCVFKADTIFIPKENKVVNAEYLQTTFKNRSNFILYKTDNGKYYLKLIVTENLYFGKIDMLELISNSKSFFAKDTKQYEFNKHTGYYMIEIFKNYIGTLKEDGLSLIIFGKAETDFTKQDSKQVKQLAECFYQTIDTKKTKQKN